MNINNVCIIYDHDAYYVQFVDVITLLPEGNLNFAAEKVRFCKVSCLKFS